jgi:Adenylate and Guanylate cyclase catalytic domain
MRRPDHVTDARAEQSKSARNKKSGTEITHYRRPRPKPVPDVIGEPYPNLARWPGVLLMPARLEDDMFCSECGTPLNKTTPSAEYKQVTVLFADVVHSMDIAAALGPERLREIMAELVDRSAEVVKRLGGTVAQFTGDGIMAVFGAPVADGPQTLSNAWGMYLAPASESLTRLTIASDFLLSREECAPELSEEATDGLGGAPG